MGSGSPTQRRYSAEFKQDAVALFRSSGRPIKEVADELGVSDTSLGSWVRAASKTAPRVETEDEQVARLRKRVRELEEEISILKKFTSYWVKEGGR
jgi:transposase